LLALALALAACTTSHVHLFGAYRYDANRDCLESAATVDVIDGPDPGKCEVLRCWFAPADEVYVTDAACDAPISFVEHTSDTSGACVKALAAYAREAHGPCLPGDAGADSGM